MSNNKEILLGTKMGWTYTFAASDAFPIEANKIFSTLTDATNYVKGNPTAYAGNVISVIYDGTVENNGVYFVKSVGANGELVKVGSDTSKEKVFIMPEDFFGEMYDGPDENGFVGKIKQEYVTDILENKYTKMMEIIDGNPHFGEFDYFDVDDYILKLKKRGEEFSQSQGLIVEQIEILEINVNRDSVDFCKVKLKGFTSYFPFTYSMFDEEPQNSDGFKRLMFIDSILTDGMNLPEENKQFFKKNMGSFADWNAQEGEVGYIENKPFYSKGDIRQIDVNGEYTIVVGEFNIGDRIDISWDLTYFDEIFRGSTSFVIQEDGEGPINYYQENDFYICGGKTFEMYAYSGGDSHYGKVTYIVNGEIKTLEEKYIPDTVIKTTPQVLSDADKNQVLDNLGIANLPFSGGESENSAVLKGGNNKVTNANEVALGKYNESNNDTMFSIGIGTSDTDRKNAFEVKGNGDIYFNDIKFELTPDTDEEVESVWNNIIIAE